MKVSENEIHLWYVLDESIEDPSLLSQYIKILTEEERKQQIRFHFKRHRHQYLVTRALVRSVLSEYASHIAPESWEFAKNAYGKPSIANKGVGIQLQFNLSHSDKMVIMAVTLNQSIGIDVEYLHRQGKTIEIADSYFSADEVVQLRGLATLQQKERFFDFWTLKEAYIKACGMGLSIPLDEFSYHFDDSGKISIEFLPERNDNSELWHFWQVKLNDIHKLSMALKSKTSDCQYALSVREIIPLSSVREVKAPIGYGYIVK